MEKQKGDIEDLWFLIPVLVVIVALIIALRFYVAKPDNGFQRNSADYQHFFSWIRN